MRKLKIGSHRFTEIHAIDEPEFGANHIYCISPIKRAPDAIVGEYSQVKFQKGPIKEYGVNGCHNEDLLIIVLDRLQSLNQGKFACRENSLAITKIEEALHWLNHRTADRVKRGVEGTYEV